MPKEESFAHLLSPGRIGRMELRNRIVVTAMGVSLGELDGTCGDRIRAYHARQAQGGAGLIIMGAVGVAWPTGGNYLGQPAISDDRFIPGLAALADTVHTHGAKLCAQLHHGGPVSTDDMQAGRPVLVPSLPDPPGGDFTQAYLLDELAAAPFGRIQSVHHHVMTADDIQGVVRQFAAAADRAKRAGMDAVEVHGGHGYILSSFLSSKSNKRTDRYGGSLENRARFLIEVIRAVRETVGPDYPVLCKLDSRELGTGGITLEDAKDTARLAEAVGIDAITVTAYHDTSRGKLHSASHTPHELAANLPFAAAIKEVVRVPVTASGRIEPALGDEAIGKRQVDFISMGRKLLADPDLPRKLAEGRAADILPCVYCYTCISSIYTGVSVRCAVNPELGFEYLERAPARAASKQVVVIGGGPGGMEAARRLDAAGHRVTLIDKGARLGGTLRFAALAYDANEKLLDWLGRQIQASGVALRLGTEATPALLRALRPDVIVVASGAKRELPAIPGSDLPHVFSGDDMRQLMLGESSERLKKKTGLVTRVAARLGAATGLTADLDFVRRSTREWMPFGAKIVIIGGELVGLELAEFLNARGRAVSVIDNAPRLGAGLSVVRRMRLLDELAEHGVTLHAGASDIRIAPKAVHFHDAAGQEQAAAADHVIVAKGATGDLGLAERLRADGFTVHTVGDCNGIGYIEGAMRGAAKVAAEI